MESTARTLPRPRWWQWPTVLSLDAPAVALLWQAMLARAAGTTVPGPRPFILGSSVWLAYAADRWFEGWRLEPEKIRTHRHDFYRRWRWPVAVLWLGVVAADVTAAWRGLTRAEFDDGLLVLGAVLAYLLSHQLIHRQSRGRVPKELCIAALLGAGVALMIAPRTPWPQLAPAAPAFALFLLLCFGNCALISVWESAVDQSHGQTSWARQFPWGATLARVFPWVLAACALPWMIWTEGAARQAAGCAFASSLLLVAVDRLEKRRGWRAARVLADVALMTPLVPLLAELAR